MKVNKLNLLLLFFAVIVLLIISGEFYILKNHITLNVPFKEKQINVSPSIAPPYKIIYGSGNNILYTSDLSSIFQGVGVIYKENKKGVKYADQIIGIFEKWKPSVDGPDRYMVLKNPFNEELYSIRTTWKNENTSTTTILKEDLTQIMSTGPTQKYLKKIGPLEQNLNLFAKGRVVITNLDVNKDSQNNSMTYTSSDGSYRTAWLVIR